MLSNFANNLQSKFVKSSIITLTIRLIGVMLQFSILLVITNNFSEQIVGKFNYINTLLILVGSICLIGMNESFLQFSGKLEALNSPGLLRNLYFKNVKILLSSFFLWATIYYLLSRVLKIKFLNVENILLLDKVFASVFFFSFSLLNFQVIRAIRKLILSEVYRNIFRYGIILTIIIFAIVSKVSEEFILNSFIIAFSVISTLTFFIIIKHTHNKTKAGDNQLIGVKEIISISAPMSFSFIAMLFMQSFDTIMIEYLLDLKKVAFYTVAVKLTFIIGIVQLSINAVVAPDISKYWFEHKKNKLRQLIHKTIKLNFILTAPLVLCMLFFSSSFLGLFGESYYAANMALKILIVGQIFNSFCGSVGLYLNMTQRQNIFLKALIAAAIVNTVLNIILIPKHGINGAAFSTSVSLILWNMIGVVYIYIKDQILIIVSPGIFK